MIHVNIIVYTTWKVENAQLPLVLVYPGPLRSQSHLLGAAPIYFDYGVHVELDIQNPWKAVMNTKI